MVLKAWRNRRIRYTGVALVALSPVILLFVTLREVRVEHASRPGDSATLAKDLALTRGDGVAWQRAVLTDNVVTFAEHEAAKLRTVQCGEAAGLRMGVEPAVGLRPSRYSITAATEPEMNAAIEKLKTCEHEYMTEIESVWSLAKAHHSDADRDRAFGQLTVCLRAKGTELPSTGIKTIADLDQIRAPVWDKSDPSVAKASALRRAHYLYCARDIEEQTGFWLP